MSRLGPGMRGRWGRPVTAMVLVVLLAMGGVAMTVAAHADDATLSDLQAQVESTAQTYEDATAKVDDLNDQIASNTARIAQIQEELPALQEASAQAITSLYKYEDNGQIWLTLLFDSQSFNDLLQTYDYLDRYEQSNLAAIDEAASMASELADREAQLESDKAEAEAEQALAQTAMEAAKSAREQAMEAAAAEAAAQAAAQEAAQQAAAASQTASGTTTTDGTTTNDTTADIPAVDAGEVDWSADKTAFVAEWSARIDAYLDGSNLAGQGTNFAAAAWDYGVDPRLSPAISCVESGKGAVCFRPYNAWGWGLSGYSSWEEAIYAHISGFARIYGSTLTYEDAVAYSGQSDPTEWYNLVYDQMEQI